MSVTYRWKMPQEILSLQHLWHMELDQLMKERETTHPDPDLWRWSPLELGEFFRMLDIARSLVLKDEQAPEHIRFAEAGSGIGTKLYTAKHYFGLIETGYEINDGYLAMSHELGVNAVKADLRTLIPPWAKYDIVYLSRPFKSDEYEVKWEQSVIDAMRPGAILMSAYAAVKPYSWPCHYRRPFRGVWVKPASSGPVYDAMISRTSAGSDPLVPEPLSRP